LTSIFDLCYIYEFELFLHFDCVE